MLIRLKRRPIEEARRSWLERAKGPIVRVVAWARGSAWASLVTRAAAVAIALSVLAWIGRAATASAGPADAPPSATASAATAALPSAAAQVPLEPSTAPDAAAPAPTARASAGARARATPDDPVYVNVADVDELRRLPGVGPKRAEAILELRRRVGRFQRVEELLRVKGVGRGTLKKWRALVRLDAPERDGGA